MAINLALVMLRGSVHHWQMMWPRRCALPCGSKIGDIFKHGSVIILETLDLIPNLALLLS